MLQWYFSWTRCCGGGGGNCHGAEVQYHIVRDFFYFISFTWNLVSFFTLGDSAMVCKIPYLQLVAPYLEKLREIVPFRIDVEVDRQLYLSYF